MGDDSMESGNYDINRQYFFGKKVFVELKLLYC